ncbi:MAG: iron ABC transporter permease [Methylococcales bacterium]|jgi:iron(III) transport system permease protein|nr:iron ABC transporter permease [Methylococcales bacterium]MBT7444828.1 iron ABC transporter permease [Methylococcales bacterium]
MRFSLSLLVLIIILPILVILAYLFTPSSAVWQHLYDTVLGTYVTQSAILMVGVGFGSLVLGITSAWLTTLCDFPLRRFFTWSLLLPMAIPAYIIAYTYTGFLDFAGPVQTVLRELFNWSYGDYWFPEVRSLTGAVIMLSLVLYPYVYLLARSAFLSQADSVLEASQSLGLSPWQSFKRVSLPLARPAIIAGLSLVMMETLADFGTVQYFGVDTFTTGIYRTWFGLDENSAAGQLSAILLIFVFTLMILERWSRQQARYHQTSQRVQHSKRYTLKSGSLFSALLFCSLLLLFSFLIPVILLSHWAWLTMDQAFDTEFLTLAGNSLLLAAITAITVVSIAVLLGYGLRIYKQKNFAFLVRLSTLGYATPGVVVAVGVMIPLSWIDHRVDAFMDATFGISTGLLLSGTIFILIFAYTVRFMSVALQSVESGLSKVRPSLDQAAQTLGCQPRQVLTRIHIPIMQGSLLTALLIVFVDVMKELPATLILRPFNFNTLAIRAYELASDERLMEAASSALAIVATGLIPVLILSYSISKQARS